MKKGELLRSHWATVAALAMGQLVLSGQSQCQPTDEDGDEWTVEDGDCDDTNADVYPGAPELCNGIDDNCDTVVDTDAEDAFTFYRDVDLDGYGDPDDVMQACSVPDGYVDNGDDCDDTSSQIYPGATEIVNNDIDEDCDGEDRVLHDLDLDGFPDLIVSNTYDGSTYKTNSYIYWGSEKGISTSDRTSLPTEGASSSCVEDFNDDGYPDVVFANQYNGSSYSISSFVYWGGSAGYSTSSRTDLPTLGARSCIAADLDQDGDPDLVFANQYSGSSYAVDSYIYWNQGGTFSSSSRTSLATQSSYYVVTSDLNADGYLELIFSSYRSDSSYSVDSYIYWGSSAGYSSSARTSLPGLGAWKAITVGDLNGDLTPDLVVNNHYNGSSYVLNSYIYYGPDYGSSTRVDIPVEGSSGSKITDFDKDGYPDILATGYYDGDDSVNSYVYFGSSRGYSSSNRQTLSANRVYDSSIRDLNSDGYADVLLAVYYDGDYSTTSRIFYGSSSGFLSSNQTTLSTYGAIACATSDVDGNGYPDVVLASHYDGDYNTAGAIYWGSERGVATSARSDVPTEGVWKLHSADFNGDGYLDLVYPNYYDGSSYENDSYVVFGKKGWSASNRVALPTNGAANACSGDFNNDGYLDLAFANYRSNSSYSTDSYVYWGSSSGFSSSNRTALPTVGAVHCVASDLDGDSDLDLTFANYYSGSSYAIDSYIYWNVSGGFSTSNRLNIPTIGAYGVSSADLDKNGYQDLVFNNYYDGDYSNGVYIYWGDSTGYSTGRRQTLAANGVWRSPTLTDVNNDTYLDIVLAGYYDGDDANNSYIYWGGSAGYSDSNRFTFSHNRTFDMLVEDLNGDGYKDVVIGSYYDGDYSTTSYVYWGASSGFSTSARTGLNTYGIIRVASLDANGDGKRDLLLAAHYDGDYSTESNIFLNTGSGYSSSGSFSLRTYGAEDVVVADLDLDGRDDVAVANYYDGSNYATSSFVYWNSSRGLSSTNRTDMPCLGGMGVQAAGNF